LRALAAKFRLNYDILDNDQRN